VMVETVMRKLRHGDLFITIGAGDVWKTGEEILRRMKDNAG
jgi:UDP-N-acetylmuramate-alanine ligase